MINTVLLYIGGGLIGIWGIGHLIPTKNIISDFGKISKENKRIIIMEWIAGGLTLFFIGILVCLVTFFSSLKEVSSLIVYWSSAGMLILMAVLSSFTGARTSILPMKLCPFVKTLSAFLIILGIVV